MAPARPRGSGGLPRPIPAPWDVRNMAGCSHSDPASGSRKVLQMASASACRPGAGPAPDMHLEKVTLRAPRRDTSASGEPSHAVFALREVRRISRALPRSQGRQARQRRLIRVGSRRALAVTGLGAATAATVVTAQRFFPQVHAWRDACNPQYPSCRCGR